MTLFYQIINRISEERRRRIVSQVHRWLLVTEFHATIPGHVILKATQPIRIAFSLDGEEKRETNLSKGDAIDFDIKWNGKTTHSIQIDFCESREQIQIPFPESEEDRSKDQ